MSAPSAPVSRVALVSTFVRSLALQASWNYRTMVGGGFGFALLPVLKRLGRPREVLEADLKRHIGRFNAHPYLAEVALGATARLEVDGEDADAITRFKEVIGGPLGGLGDALVWAAWLPTTLLVALALAWVGIGPLVCLLVFLTLYNVGHLWLRIWGFRVGWESGKDVGSRLRNAHLGRVAEHIGRGGSLLCGVLIGILLTGEPGFADPRWLWPPAILATVAIGLFGGHRVWRPTALLMVVAVSSLALFGRLS